MCQLLRCVLEIKLCDFISFSKRFVPCAPLPYCIGACKNVNHHCSVCGIYIGSYRRSGWCNDHENVPLLGMGWWCHLHFDNKIQWTEEKIGFFYFVLEIRHSTCKRIHQRRQPENFTVKIDWIQTKAIKFVSFCRVSFFPLLFVLLFLVQYFHAHKMQCDAQIVIFIDNMPDKHA